MGKRRGSLISVFFLSLALALAFNGCLGPVSHSEGAILSGGKAEDCYIGGFPVAMVLKVDGVIVEDAGDSASAAAGDIIVGLNGERIIYAEDIEKALCSLSGSVELTVKRGKAIQKIEAVVKREGSASLGLTVRDTVAGIGMITFVKTDGVFGALGHKISDPLVDEFDFIDGSVYDCKILGLKRGVKGTPGEIKGAIAGRPIGKIFRNTRCGIYGKFFEITQLPLQPISIAEATETAPGKAEITTDLGEGKKSYQVEIIKPFALGRKEKGMVLRVTDKELLSCAGGIIQGMSGSPIVQNGKLIGAVTHVFVNDPTKGYGIYASLMNDLS